MTRRYNKKWNVNEELALQREYELLEWTVSEIATKHERSDKAILFKLQKEGFIKDWSSARGFNACNLDAEYFGETHNNLLTSSLQSPNNEPSIHSNNISDRVEMLETNFFEFKIILTKLLSDIIQLKNQSKFQSLEL
jgi:hypothetical protein